MAPMTRSRATAEGALATPLMAEYYAQRAGAGLIITEGIQPSAVGQGYTNTPGLHSAEQVEAWKQVTTAVHEAGGVIFAQLMHAGRIGHRATLPEGMVPQGPSAVQPQGKIFTPQGLQEFEAPHELTEAEIQSTIADFAHAAKNAIAAGFDGVEIHGANGYIIQQFLSVNANQRTDRWGGSAENRRRFALEVARAVASEIGAEKTGIRLSPGSTINDIVDDPDTAATYVPLVEELGELNLAYLHIGEQSERDLTLELRKAWPNTFILNPRTGFGNPTGPDALELIEDGTADMISFGALFIANPDLPVRLRSGGPFNTPIPSAFYGGGAEGYTDYTMLA